MKHLQYLLVLLVGLSLFWLATRVESSTQRPKAVVETPPPSVPSLLSQIPTADALTEPKPETKKKAGAEPAIEAESPFAMIADEFGMKAEPQPLASGQACTSFDPINYPEDAKEIIYFVSAETGVPTWVLYGIWKAETDGEVYGDRGGAGNCYVSDQYRIRNKWLPGNGSKNVRALRQIAQNNGWSRSKHWGLRGSCGKSTVQERKGSFGGCIGPMQITPVEWIEEPDHNNRDPLVLCDSMTLTARRLKRHYEKWVDKNKSNNWSWRRAIRQYVGNPTGKGSMRYYRRVRKHGRIWEAKRQSEELDKFICTHAEKKGWKWRGGKTLICN